MTDFDEIDPDVIASELHEIRGALLNDKVAVLGPAEPVCLRESATVQEAVERMLAHRQAGVLVVDAADRLIGHPGERLRSVPRHERSSLIELPGSKREGTAEHAE